MDEIERLAEAISAWSNQRITASEAAQRLRDTLAQAAVPTAEATTALAGLGVTFAEIAAASPASVRDAEEA